ncbi:hypothetical protein ID866_5741 [Astraeus odoratus]|nr:hypothetical protein ID866_5741 [Astraeus odoratus]
MSPVVALQATGGEAEADTVSGKGTAPGNAGIAVHGLGHLCRMTGSTIEAVIAGLLPKNGGHGVAKSLPFILICSRFFTEYTPVAAQTHSQSSTHPQVKLTRIHK